LARAEQRGFHSPPGGDSKSRPQSQITLEGSSAHTVIRHEISEDIGHTEDLARACDHRDRDRTSDEGIQPPQFHRHRGREERPGEDDRNERVGRPQFLETRVHLSPHRPSAHATTEWSRILLPGCSRTRKQRTRPCGSKQTLSSWPCTD
jgi:hypothetical protein